LSWRATDASALVLEPGPVDVPVAPDGSGWAELPVTGPTTFVLTALGPGGAGEGTVRVGVAGV
jgi:hypothetical protein